jgi:hypothetical protein
MNIYSSVPEGNKLFTPNHIECVNTKSRIYLTYGTGFYWCKKFKAYEYNGTSKAGHIAGEFINSKMPFLIFLYTIWNVNENWLVKKNSAPSIQ